MYIVYYDSGTTNTRAYLLRDGAILQKVSRPVGARNSALSGERDELLRALAAMYQDLLGGNGIADHQISGIYMSGMISSPSGLVEVEHIPVPIDCADLGKCMVRYRDDLYFKRDIWIVPGVKTLKCSGHLAPEEAWRMSIMRGEETEIFGILRYFPSLRQGRHVILLPGSHTQAVFVEAGRIVGIFSNITGELFRAVTEETILGAAVAGEETWKIEDEMVYLGWRNLQEYGMNRALYILRVLHLFSDLDVNGRRSYLEGVLNGGVVDAAAKALGEDGGILAIAGDTVQFALYRAICTRAFPQIEAVQVLPPEGMEFSVGGLLSVLDGLDVKQR